MATKAYEYHMILFLTAEQTNAQRSWNHCPKSHSQKVAEAYSASCFYLSHMPFWDNARSPCATFSAIKMGSVVLVVSSCNDWSRTIPACSYQLTFPLVSYAIEDAGCKPNTRNQLGFWSWMDHCSLHIAVAVGLWAVFRKWPLRAIALRLERQFESMTEEL